MSSGKPILPYGYVSKKTAKFEREYREPLVILANGFTSWRCWGCGFFGVSEFV